MSETPQDPEHVYAPPEAEVDDVASDPDGEDERLRSEHLAIETGIRRLGLFLATVGALCAIWATATLLHEVPPSWGTGASRLTAALVVLFGAAVVLAGAGLWCVWPWSRRFGIGLAVVLAAISGYYLSPVGVFAFYVVNTLNSAQAKVIFSAGYGDVLEATPQAKAATSRSTWVVVGITAVLMAGAAAAGILIGILEVL